MLHPDTALAFIDKDIGHGIVATRRIPKGTIVWVHDRLDLRLGPAQVAALGSQYDGILDHFSYLNRDGERVLCWDLARYFNHSCEPTCLSPGLDFEVLVRDVEPGEQLTDDYSALNLEQSFSCACRSEWCRQIVRPEDFDRLAPEWDSILGEVCGDIPSVQQPLMHLVSPQDRAILDVALLEREKLPSILQHRWIPERRRARKNGKAVRTANARM